MGTLCYSVRLASLVRVSGKAYLATSFDGREAILPASQVFGRDYSVTRSDAYWISAWILSKRDLQYSSKKECWFDKCGRVCCLVGMDADELLRFKQLSDLAELFKDKDFSEAKE